MDSCTIELIDGPETPTYKCPNCGYTTKYDKPMDSTIRQYFEKSYGTCYECLEDVWMPRAFTMPGLTIHVRG